MMEMPEVDVLAKDAKNNICIIEVAGFKPATPLEYGIQKFVN